MPIAQFEGRALVFNNGVVDVRQGDTSLVDSEKVAHIPESNVAIDNETIIRNANQQLEVPIDEDTIYMDDHGFMKSKGGKEYTGGNDIEITSEGVINYTGSGGGGSVEIDSETIILNSENELEVNKDIFPVIVEYKPEYAYGSVDMSDAIITDESDPEEYYWKYTWHSEGYDGDSDWAEALRPFCLAY